MFHLAQENLIKFIWSIKAHRRNLLLLFLIFAFTSLTFLGIFSLLPPTVNAAFSPTLNPDQSFTTDVWGSLDTRSLQVFLDPPTPFKIRVVKGFFPFYQQVVIEPQTLFLPETTYQLTLTAKNWIGSETKKSFQTSVGTLPEVTYSFPQSQAKGVLAGAPLTFQLNKFLSKGDLVFSSNPPFSFTKKISGNSLVILPKNRLIQGQSYATTLTFTDPNIGSETLFTNNFTVISPLELTNTTPRNTSNAVGKQSSLAFSFNKPLSRGSFEKSLVITPTTPGNYVWDDDQNVKFVPTNFLLSGTKYSVTLPDTLSAQDHSQLTETKNFSFTTAGPVAVLGISPTGTFFPTSTTVQVNFDQPVDQVSAQDHFSINPAVSGNFSWSGNSLIFRPKTLNLLTTYQVKVSSGVKTIGGEDSNQDFTSSFTTTGERIVTIGSSVKGRPLKAYYYGSGSKKILLLGAIHGNESNTSTMLNNWINYLRTNQAAISSERTFIIVPNTNPDGTAANNRFNAHGVDLNRNWDLPNWQALTYWQNSSYPNGGGSTPFSEPETQALRNLIVSENPSRIITYHSAANLVIGGGDSDTFATWYSSLTGYVLSIDNSEDSGSCQSAVGYCVTGSLEEWAGTRGNQTIVVEFSSMTNPEYSRNLPALKGLLTLSL